MKVIPYVPIPDHDYVRLRATREQYEALLQELEAHRARRPLLDEERTAIWRRAGRDKQEAVLEAIGIPAADLRSYASVVAAGGRLHFGNIVGQFLHRLADTTERIEALRAERIRKAEEALERAARNRRRREGRSL